MYRCDRSGSTTCLPNDDKNQMMDGMVPPGSLSIYHVIFLSIYSYIISSCILVKGKFRSRSSSVGWWQKFPPPCYVTPCIHIVFVFWKKFLSIRKTEQRKKDLVITYSIQWGLGMSVQEQHTQLVYIYRRKRRGGNRRRRLNSIPSKTSPEPSAFFDSPNPSRHYTRRGVGSFVFLLSIYILQLLLLCLFFFCVPLSLYFSSSSYSGECHPESNSTRHTSHSTFFFF